MNKFILHSDTGLIIPMPKQEATFWLNVAVNLTIETGYNPYEFTRAKDHTLDYLFKANERWKSPT